MDMVRILIGFLLAFAWVVALGPVYIGLLGRLGYGKRIRVEGPEGHLVKFGCKGPVVRCNVPARRHSGARHGTGALSAQSILKTPGP